MRILIALCFAGFPLLVYLFADRWSPAFLVLTFAGLALARLSLIRAVASVWLWSAAAAIVVFCILSLLDEDLWVFKLYPVFLSAAGAGFFAYTLRHPPCAIRRMVEATGGTVSAAGESYVWWVTMVWMIFFIANAGISLWTAVAANTATWALYNGAISYAAIAALFGLEYMVRIWYRRQHD